MPHLFGPSSRATASRQGKSVDLSFVLFSRVYVCHSQGSEHLNELYGCEIVAGCDDGVPTLQEVNKGNFHVGTEALWIPTIGV
ncbi:hypothetical protein QYM36_012432 [Artemia franciscana]|uniref:Uncharacterized protein n=1 Tax=Artemia franciscana TaxID=6661 RepID=A0AA88HH69_ARTSF|nr:hypothetical protein QYM36_012432 [Artemia franciscana]